MLEANIWGMARPSRRERTHERLIACALDLFERQGFAQTPVAQIAAAAGVTEMTFFRHFETKDAVVITDPYDPAIVAAIAAEPTEAPPARRAIRGVRAAFAGLPEPAVETVRRRVKIIAASPALRASTAQNNETTEGRIRDQLVADGASPFAAAICAASLMAALTAALYWWASESRTPLADTVRAALEVLGDTDA